MATHDDHFLLLVHPLCITDEFIDGHRGKSVRVMEEDSTDAQIKKAINQNYIVIIRYSGNMKPSKIMREHHNLVVYPAKQSADEGSLLCTQIDNINKDSTLNKYVVPRGEKFTVELFDSLKDFI